MNSDTNWVWFLGRFHPLLVHLPIGFLVIVVALETLARAKRFRSANASSPYILALAVPAAMVTAITGWLLSTSGDYDAQLLLAHRVLGLSTAAVCALIAFCRWAEWRRCYLASLYLGAGLLAVTSHFGGSLTHGSDYLTRYAPGFHKAAAEERSLHLAALGTTASNLCFETVQPVLHSRCGACHNFEKHKGGLRLDRFADVMKGGEHGLVIFPGDAAGSPLIKRLLLPADDDDHMPPAGKPQPRPEEIDLLRRWIQAGAPANELVGAERSRTVSGR